MKISIDKIHAFIFDFDGVMTNNLVYIDQDGKETVRCNRADGLAFDVLRKLNKPAFIVSTEKSQVVAMRAKKLRIPVIQGVSDKVKAVQRLAINNSFNLKNILYVGNDLNDYHVMKFCGLSACPSDSHTKIKELSDIMLKTKGGEGVVRELLENIFNINFIKILQEN
jgi:3-deoxy-D-manno-octulosonate 8-phosphate phosphatase (KDO 8-P phosphatase)